MNTSAQGILRAEVAPLESVETDVAFMKYAGSCHCQSVQFTLEWPQGEPLVAWQCNCSICFMKRNTHIVVPQVSSPWPCSMQVRDVFSRLPRLA